MYSSLKALCGRYEFSKYRMKKILDALPLRHNEHFIIVAGEHRYDSNKLHHLLTENRQDEKHDEILSRLLV